MGSLANEPIRPPAGTARLRFGLLCSGTTLRRWQADALRALLDEPGVELALLVVDARPRPSRQPADRVRRLVRSPTALWDTYNNGWVARRSAALAPVDLSTELAGVTRLDVVVDQQGYSEYFPAEAVEAIRAERLDFLLRFAFGIIRGDILDAATYGVWSFHHDDEERYRGSPPAFWELVDDQPVSGAVLQRLTDRLDGGQVLTKGWFRSTPSSYVRNTDAVHLGSSDWPARVARGILAGDTTLGEGEPSRSTAPIYKNPGNRRTTRFLAGQAWRFARAQVEGVLVADQWGLGRVDAPLSAWLDPAFTPRVEWLDAVDPQEAYAADPFAVPGTDPPVVLFERFDHAARRGEIWKLDLGSGGPARPAGLPVQAHASYPYLFADGDQIYGAPQVDGEPLRLFALDGTSWVEAGTLLPHPVLDPTIVEHEGRWWLFATRPGSYSLTKLHLWWADQPTGPWHEHPLNPVKTDVRSARPAGTPFVHDGILHRPAQDCASGYGAAVALCRVTRLDPMGFDEEVVRVVEPDPTWPYDAGVHTLSGTGDITFIDARRRAVNRHETTAEVRARLRRLRHR